MMDWGGAMNIIPNGRSREHKLVIVRLLPVIQY